MTGAYIEERVGYSQLRDRSRLEQRPTKTSVYTLACTEAGRHSISELIPPLAFVPQRFIPPIAPRPRLLVSPLSPHLSLSFSLLPHSLIYPTRTIPSPVLTRLDVHERANRVSQTRVPYDRGLTWLSSRSSAGVARKGRRGRVRWPGKRSSWVNRWQEELDGGIIGKISAATRAAVCCPRRRASIEVLRFCRSRDTRKRQGPFVRSSRKLHSSIYCSFTGCTREKRSRVQKRRATTPYVCLRVL